VATIGFTAIVKNEAHVIRRALDSVRPLVDHVLISDTGSTDGTPGVIRSWLDQNDLPGAVIERPWVDFSHNRNEALDLLSDISSIDYVLTIDADEYLVFDQTFDTETFKSGLDRADAWRVRSHVGSQHFDRLQLFSNRMPFRFHYKIHEKVNVPSGAVIGRAEGFFNQYTFDGARAFNPRKYLEDAKTIESELIGGAYDNNPEMLARYTFYLAQCFNWSRNYDQARVLYERHTKMKGASRGNLTSSYFNIALMDELLEEPAETTIAAYLRAYQVLPEAEPLCGAARISNRVGRHDQAYNWARSAAAMPEPDSWSFDAAVYQWRALDELLVACIGTHRFDEAVEVAERLLSEAKFPESERQRIEQNAAYALAQYELAPVIGPNAKSALAN